MNKHTPGPWRWVQHDKSMLSLEGGDGMVHHVLSHGPCKACQKRIKDDESIMDKCTVVGPDDARLIAAAPDMAEALRAFIEAEDSFREHTQFDADVADDWLCEAYNKARAALAKAGL